MLKHMIVAECDDKCLDSAHSMKRYIIMHDTWMCNKTYAMCVCENCRMQNVCWSHLHLCSTHFWHPAMYDTDKDNDLILNKTRMWRCILRNHVCCNHHLWISIHIILQHASKYKTYIYMQCIADKQYWKRDAPAGPLQGPGAERSRADVLRELILRAGDGV